MKSSVRSITASTNIMVRIIYTYTHKGVVKLTRNVSKKNIDDVNKVNRKN